MNTLVTDRKFTVMLSAYQAQCSELDNLVNTELLHHYIEHDLHCHPIRAVGVYHGDTEQSFVIHTNSSNVVSQLKRHVLDEYNQECVLVSNNRKHEVLLHNQDATAQYIGERFTRHYSTPKGANSYTIINGKDYYTVS